MGAVVLALAGCSAGGPSGATASVQSLRVEALSPPVAWLVREIGGDRVEVREITPEGADPMTFRPEPARIAALAEADLIVASGAGFEGWLALASVPTSRLVVASEGLPLIQGDGPVHRHGDGPEHSHAGPIPHVWLDPALFAAQADRIAQALAAREPQHAEEFRVRGAAVVARIEPLSAELAAVGEALAERPIIANHPTFAYLGRAAGWSLRWGAIDPQSSDPAPFLRLVGDREGVVALWDAAPSVDLIVGAPSTVVHCTLDPVAIARRGEDPISRMRANFDRLRAVVAR